MPSDPYDRLDGPVTYLAQDVADAVAPVTLATSSGTALPLYTRATAAAEHASRLPTLEGPGVVARTVAADDPRGKEEVLRAAVANGATLVAFDPDEDLRPEVSLAIEFALGYVVGHKRNTACM